MANDVELTEMIDLDADELHLVKRGANGFPPLLAKAAAEVAAVRATSPRHATAFVFDNVETRKEKPKMSKADKAAQKAIAKSTRRSLDQLAARKAAATTLNAVAKAVIAPRLARIAELRKMLDDAEGDQARSAVGVLLMREELSSGRELDAMAKLGLASKSPGVPLFSTRAPKATGRSAQFAQSGWGGPMTSGTHAPRSIDTPGGETPAVGGSATYGVPAEANLRDQRFNALNTRSGIVDQLRNIIDPNRPHTAAPAELPSLVNNHRRNTTLQRDETQENIDRLQKEYDQAMAGSNPDRASQLSYQLTKAKLMQMHAEGDVRNVPVFGGR